jgi:predicted permease
MARIGEIIAQDLGHAVRGLRRQPGFALAAISILALAIGATTAVASLVYGVLLRPLPYTDPDRLVRLWEEHPGGATIAGNRWLSHRTYWQWRRDVRSLQAIGGYIASSGVIRIGAEHESLSTASLTPSMIEMLGLTPAVGRWFTDYDAVAGAPRVAVLAHGLWREKFGARGDIIGTSVMLDDELTEIVGVAPPWMRFPSEAVEVWQPYRVPTVEEEPRRTMGFNAVARLAPGTAREQVQAEGTVAARSVEQPMSAEIVFGKGGPPVVHARRLRDDTAADVRPALLALAAAVALILLVACANVASLLLSRGLARERDAAIRLAIGSSRARLASQALMESAVLAALGGIAGTVVAWGLVRLLPLVAPPRFPRLAEVRLDLPVLLIAVTATIVAAVLAAVLPAWRCGTGDTTASMRGSSHSVGDGFRTRGRAPRRRAAAGPQPGPPHARRSRIHPRRRHHRQHHDAARRRTRARAGTGGRRARAAAPAAVDLRRWRGQQHAHGAGYRRVRLSRRAGAGRWRDGHDTFHHLPGHRRLCGGAGTAAAGRALLHRR